MIPLNNKGTLFPTIRAQGGNRKAKVQKDTTQEPSVPLLCLHDEIYDTDYAYSYDTDYGHVYVTDYDSMQNPS